MFLVSQAARVILMCNQRGESGPHPQLNPQPAGSQSIPGTIAAQNRQESNSFTSTLSACGKQNKTQGKDYKAEKPRDKLKKQNNSDKGVNFILIY